MWYTCAPPRAGRRVNKRTTHQAAVTTKRAVRDYNAAHRMPPAEGHASNRRRCRGTRGSRSLARRPRESLRRSRSRWCKSLLPAKVTAADAADKKKRGAAQKPARDGEERERERLRGRRAPERCREYVQRATADKYQQDICTETAPCSRTVHGRLTQYLVRVMRGSILVSCFYKPDTNSIAFLVLTHFMCVG